MQVIDARTSAKTLNIELDPSAGKRSPWILRLFIVMLAIHVAVQFFPEAIYTFGWANKNALAGEYWRLFTYNFLHGGWVHLLLNSLALWVFAKSTEIHFGTRGWIAIFLVSGTLGGIPELLFRPEVTMVGASAGIMGLYGATIAAALRLRDIPKSFKALENKLNLGSLVMWLLFQFVLDRMVPQIAAWAHMGGAAVGFLIGFILTMRGSSRVLVSDRAMIEQVSGTAVRKTKLHGLHFGSIGVTLAANFDPAADCVVVVHEGLGFWDSDRDTALVLAGKAPAPGSAAWNSLKVLADPYQIDGVGTVEEALRQALLAKEAEQK